MNVLPRHPPAEAGP